MKKFLVMVLAVMLICVGIISVSSAENNLFTYKKLDDGTIEITRVANTIKDEAIPAGIDGYKVTSIGSFAFSACNNLNNVIIPDSVTVIRCNAFRSCKNLKSVTIPDSVTTIEEGAFPNCEKLTAFVISPDHPVYVFNNNMLIDKNEMTLLQYTGKKAEPYEVYWGIRRIGNGAFESTKLNSIVIPNSVTSIGEYAFRYMNNLKEISIPDSVTVLGSEALFRTPSLTALWIPASVTEIGSDCFGWCSKLKTIEIDPENPVYEMRGSLLVNKKENMVCYHLDVDAGTVEVPEGIESLQAAAFQDSLRVKEIIIPDTVKSIGRNAFAYCPAMTAVRLPNGLQTIESFTFQYCKTLKSVTIPEGVTEIGICAFESCSALTEVIIPASVTNIDATAFTKCNRVVCKVVEGSYAQKFCEKNGIKFVIQ